MNEFCRKILFNDVLIRDSVYDKSVDWGVLKGYRNKVQGFNKKNVQGLE